MNLVVKLLDRRVGVIANDRGPISFSYDTEYVSDPSAAALSVSLPPREEPFGQRQTLAYFANLLPEEEQRELIAKAVGVSSENAFGLLAEIGMDCAGAVVIVPADSDDVHAPAVALSGPEVSRRLDDLANRRVTTTGATIDRMSLAGAQAKLPVVIHDDQWLIPQDQFTPTTHIVKPHNPRFTDLVSNEHFCMELARQCGLNVSEVSTGETLDGLGYLIVRRYDRDELTGSRLHQEDFCQALSLPPELKYENSGGPGLQSSFDLIDRVSAVPARDKLEFWKALIFNHLIGNCDAHGKNFSLLYESAAPSLAPLYDLVSTTVYPGLTTQLAMRIGDAKLLDEVAAEDFHRVAEAAGLAPRNAMRIAEEFALDVSRHSDSLMHGINSDSEILSRIVAGIAARASVLTG